MSRWHIPTNTFRHEVASSMSPCISQRQHLTSETQRTTKIRSSTRIGGLGRQHQGFRVSRSQSIGSGEGGLVTRIFVDEDVRDMILRD